MNSILPYYFHNFKGRILSLSAPAVPPIPAAYLIKERSRRVIPLYSASLTLRGLLIYNSLSLFGDSRISYYPPALNMLSINAAIRRIDNIASAGYPRFHNKSFHSPAKYYNSLFVGQYSNHAHRRGFLLRRITWKILKTFLKITKK